MTARFVVEKGIAVPVSYLVWYNHRYGNRNNIGAARLYPFDTMEIGDSFVILNPRAVRNAKEAARVYGSRFARRYAVTLDDDKRWRCWRLK